MKVIHPNFPPGTVVPFAGATAPAGWLLCDGTTYSRALYPALFSAIGTAWGSGDGSTTFHTPDMRGRFARGRDNSAGRDADRASRTASNSGGNTGDNVGSVQANQTLSHAHNIKTQYWNVANTLTHNGLTSTADVAPGQSVSSQTYINNAAAIYTNGGSETRPQNANFNYIIKV